MSLTTSDGITTARSISVVLCLQTDRKTVEGTQPSKPLGQRPGRRPQLTRTVHTTKSTTPRAQPLLPNTQATRRNVLLMSLWFLLVCHALTQNDAESPVSIFLLTFTKAIKNTCPHKKSLHQDMVCLFK